MRRHLNSQLGTRSRRIALIRLTILAITGGVLSAQTIHPASTAIFRASGTLAVIDVNGDGGVNYGSVAPDEVFYYPLAADSSTAGDVPVVGDWNGDGRSKIGVFRHDGAWFLDSNGNGTLDSGDLVFQYTATPGDVPVVGDWNGSGTTKTGIFRNGLWILDYDGDGVVNYSNLGADLVFQYTATAGDLPLVGDWNHNGKTKTGIFRGGAWILDANGDGVINGSDLVFQYTATSGDVPVVGDWNGSGSTKTGIFRDGCWILDYDGDGVVNYSSKAKTIIITSLESILQRDRRNSVSRWEPGNHFPLPQSSRATGMRTSCTLPHPTIVATS